MTSSLPPYPDFGETGWNDELEARINGVQAIAEAAAAAVDTGGNVVVPSGSKLSAYTDLGNQVALTITENPSTHALTTSWALVTPADPLPGNPGDTGGGGAPANDDPDLLTIGAHTHAINGTNIYRDTGFLVRYTWSASQTITPTNLYGVEVVVNATTHQVVSVNNRLTTSAALGTTFTSGQYVLSGHELDYPGHTGTSGQFLLDYATVGATVALSGDGGGSSGGGTGDPVPPATTSKLFGPWFQIFRSPKLGSITPSAAAKYNHYSIALLQSGGAGTGKMQLPIEVETRAELTTDVNALRAAGKNVLLAFGGQSDGGITITNTTQTQQAFDSLKLLKEGPNPIDFNGIDVDLEPSGSTWTQAPLKALLVMCRQRWGDDFIIALTPGLYGEYTAKWMALAQALGPTGFTYMSPMLYDFPQATTTAQLMPVIRDKIDTMNAAGIPDSQIMLALMLQPFAGYSASPAAVINQCVQTSMAEHPNLRGVILWEHSIEHDQGYPIAHGPVPGYLGL